MFEGLYNSASGMVTQAKIQEVIANNISKALVPGYKKLVAVNKTFNDELNSNVNDSKTERGKVGGVEIDDVYTIFDQGQLKTTGNPLDIAIDGEGFFAIQANGQEYYTRNGKFSISSEGKLVTPEGHPVMGEHGEITISKGGKINPAIVRKIIINPDGSIVVQGNNLKDNTTVGTLKIVKFENTDTLEPIGSSLFMAGNNTEPQKADSFSVSQGYLEQSNVNILDEMVSMMINMRIYETNQKILKNMSDSFARGIGEIGRV